MNKPPKRDARLAGNRTRVALAMHAADPVTGLGTSAQSSVVLTIRPAGRRSTRLGAGESPILSGGTAAGAPALVCRRATMICRDNPGAGSPLTQTEIVKHGHGSDEQLSIFLPKLLIEVSVISA